MSKFQFKGNFKNDQGGVKVNLILVSFQDENGIQFIYSPHLDLTGYGNTEQEAKDSFNIAFEDFVDYTIKKRTLPSILEKLGWTLKGGTKKKPKKINAPSLGDVIKDNDYVSEIFDTYPTSTRHAELEMPAFA